MSDKAYDPQVEDRIANSIIAKTDVGGTGALSKADADVKGGAAFPTRRMRKWLLGTPPASATIDGSAVVGSIVSEGGERTLDNPLRNDDHLRFCSGLCK